MNELQYPPAIADLWQLDRLPELGPGDPNKAMRPALAALNVDELFPKCRDREAALGCVAGLWLYHDFLDESHALSQELPGWIGSYWHAIMHRREPDPANSKYWWRRVGANPVFDSLAKEMRQLAYTGARNGWHPEEFVDHCEAERGSGSDQEIVLRRVQKREIELLFEWSYCRSIGG